MFCIVDIVKNNKLLQNGLVNKVKAVSDMLTSHSQISLNQTNKSPRPILACLR